MSSLLRRIAGNIYNVPRYLVEELNVIINPIVVDDLVICYSLKLCRSNRESGYLFISCNIF